MEITISLIKDGVMVVRSNKFVTISLLCFIWPCEIVNFIRLLSRPRERTIPWPKDDVKITKTPNNSPNINKIQHRETPVSMIDFVKETNKEDQVKKEEVIEIK
jgi:hypothetical protein